MKLGTRRDKSTPPGTVTLPLVAILYSQPTVAPIVTLVASPLTVAKRKVGKVLILAKNGPSTLYHEVPAGCVYFSPFLSNVAFAQPSLSVSLASAL